ncbi:MAG: hypothetical protein A3H27_13555 [Acidobacteria bacterium RIFCSPLOWO2_02_FULL_59_13]|nr:MAG: hypothetical protein A3H27_13555 [Acidobacteria bacterium RIFCSPLOWO2_02_FULL_59_13]
MLFLMRVTIPVEAGNAMVRDPNFAKQLDQILSDIKPEAAYFTAERGQRAMYLFVQMKDSSQLPSLTEPFWLSLKADVECIPVMTQKDMKKAAASIEKAARKY